MNLGSKDRRNRDRDGFRLRAGWGSSATATTYRLRQWCVYAAPRAIIAGVAMVLCSAVTQPASAGLEFNIAAAPGGVPQQMLDGFIEASQHWSAVFYDDVTLNIMVAFTSFPSLGITLFEAENYSYSDVRAALAADISSADDQAAYDHLQAGPEINLLINRTSNSPYGAGSATSYLDNDGDANNLTMAVARGNAKALGLVAPDDTARDALIVIDSTTAWDFDRSNGIATGQYDFVGVATHELGHALGFLSGVDSLDLSSSGNYYPDDYFTFASPMDLFRFSAASLSQGVGIIDWTADARAKYYSLDGGITPIEGFSTGDVHGNGAQASHWLPSSSAIMNPYSSAGVQEMITSIDVQLLDVIGWDTVFVDAPEPSSFALLGTGAAVLFVCCVRQRRCHSN